MPTKTCASASELTVTVTVGPSTVYSAVPLPYPVALAVRVAVPLPKPNASTRAALSAPAGIVTVSGTMIFSGGSVLSETTNGSVGGSE